MQHLKEKSVCNIKSADLLIQHQLYASSIHCSYYACIMVMLCIDREMNSCSDDEYYRLKKAEEDRHSGSHNRLIFLFKRLVSKSTVDWSTQQTFMRIIDELKQLRVDADYENKPIDEATAKTAKRHASDVLKTIKKASNK